MEFSKFTVKIEITGPEGLVMFTTMDFDTEDEARDAAHIAYDAIHEAEEVTAHVN